MLYDYQYDIAAAVVTAVIFGVYAIRRSYATKPNRIFGAMLGCNFIASVFDAVSCFSISYPLMFPNALNYFISIVYMLNFHLLSVIFLLYIDAKAKIPHLKKTVFTVAHVFSAFYIFSILTTPLTHAVFYFDKQGGYGHGPLIYVFYVLPFFTFSWEIYILFMAKTRFNRYQLLASVGLICVMGISILIQIIFPRLLISQISMISTQIFIYAAFENPADYTYRDTRCFNHRAFYQRTKGLSHKSRDYHLLGMKIHDYDSWRHRIGAHNMEKVSTWTAGRFYDRYHHDVFCLAEEKYVILYENRDSIAQAKREIQEMFSHPVTFSNTDVTVEFDFCELYDLDSDFEMQDIDDMIEYCVIHPDDHSDSKTILNKISEEKRHKEQLLYLIRRAISRDEFNVYFQPIYHWQTGHFESAEALLRLYDKEMGFINPEELVVMAEQNGYIDQIGEIVFRKVCQFIMENDIEQFGMRYIEINLSPMQCMREDLVENFSNIMNTYHVRPNQINLEITETAQIENSSRILSNVEAFHKIGVEFSIDDYGSGFASADYLIRLPVSIVKIDKSILWMAMKNESAMIVLQNTINMIKDLGKEIVVEGVEDEEMAGMLGEYGCDFMQGYFYSKPVTDTKFIEYVKTKIKEREARG